jgi:hypothetical protein
MESAVIGKMARFLFVSRDIFFTSFFELFRLYFSLNYPLGPVSHCSRRFWAFFSAKERGT